MFYKKETRYIPIQHDYIQAMLYHPETVINPIDIPCDDERVMQGPHCVLEHKHIDYCPDRPENTPIQIEVVLMGSCGTHA